MKNKGLFTRPSLTQLGNHKSEPPTQFPNRIEVTSEDQVATEHPPAHDRPDLAEQPAAQSAEATPSPARPPKKPPPEKGPIEARRYTLNVQIEASSKTFLDQLLDGLSQPAMVKAKRALMRSFRKELVASKPVKSTYNPEDPVTIRVDLKLPPDFKEAVMKAEGALIYEETATVLSRNFAPHLDRFLRRALSKNGR
jgi:hypothetical protein